MVWHELFGVLPGATAKNAEAAALRLRASIDELFGAMQAFETAEKEKSAEALVAVEWRAATFSVEPFDVLDRSVPRSRRAALEELRSAVQNTLDQTSRAARLGSGTEVLGMRAALLAHRRELELLGLRIARDARRRRLFRVLLLLGPGLLASGLVFYLRAERGLELERIEALAPAGGYVPMTRDGGVLTPRGEYLDEFMREFSKHYFGHPSQFESLYYDRTEDGTPTERRTLQHKISLRNDSHGKVSYVSSLEAVVEVSGEADFPWHRLTVAPHVVATLEQPPASRSLVLKSDGIGPALDVEWSVKTASGLELAKGQRPILHRERQPVLAQLAPGIGTREVQAGAFSPPVYFRLAGPPPTPVPPQYFEVKAPAAPPATSPSECVALESNYGWYEEVSSLTRLRELTAVAYSEPWQLEARHVSLKGEASRVRLSGRLEPGELYFRSSERLHSDDPRCTPIGLSHPGSDSDGVPDMVANPAELLTRLFKGDEELAQPQGVDLITAELGLDLYQARPGQRLATTATLDGFLNPQGVLAVYLTMNMPSSARYDVTLRANGYPVIRYHFDGISPEQMSFEQEGHEAAVARLRRVFGVSSTPSVPGPS